MSNYWYWWECFKAKQAGLRDGKDYGKNNTLLWEKVKDEKGKIQIDTDGKPKYKYTSCEVEMVKKYNAGIQEIVQRWAPTDQKFKGNYCIALKNKTDAEDIVKQLNDDYNKVKGKYEKLETNKQKFEPPPIEPKWFYWPLLCFLGLLEIPFNVIVARPFGHSEIFNYSIAILLGAVLVGGGHFLGRGCKEKNILTVFISIFIVVGLSFSIAWLRKNYLTLGGIEFPPMTMFWIFFIIGMTIFCVAMLISYSQHEERDKVQTILKSLKETQEKLNRIAHKKEVFQKKANFWTAKVEKIDTERIGFLKKNYAQVNQCIDTAKSIINVYRGYLEKNYLKYKKPETERPEVPLKYLRLGGYNEILESGDEKKLDRECVS